MAKIEEIVVIGKRPIDDPSVFTDGGSISRSFAESFGETGAALSRIREVAEPAAAGLAAVAITEPIPEITVTAKRPPPKLRLIRGTRLWPGLLRGATIGAGTIASGIAAAAAAVVGLDQLRRQQEQDAWEQADVRDKERQDAELRRLAEEMSAEITVYGKRLDATPYYYPFERFPFESPQVLPSPGPSPAPTPEFLPDIVPDIPSIPPATVPQPTSPTVPATQPAFVPVPGPTIIPGNIATPAPSPGPGRLPGQNPLFRPGRQPSSRPQPRLRPRQRPERLTSSPGLTGLGALAVPFQQPVPQEKLDRDKKCKPCKKRKKEKEERRKKCFKKLVFEREFERWDRVVKWTQIDCSTGREI